MGASSISPEAIRVILDIFHGSATHILTTSASNLGKLEKEVHIDLEVIDFLSVEGDSVLSETLANLNLNPRLLSQT